MYVILWEFIVRPENADAFIAAYKSDGAWASLFARADGYLGTELIRSTEAAAEPRFLTIDRWNAPEDFTRFQQQFGVEYKTLDTQLEGLTISERKLGTFMDN